VSEGRLRRGNRLEPGLDLRAFVLNLLESRQLGRGQPDHRLLVVAMLPASRVAEIQSRYSTGPSLRMNLRRLLMSTWTSVMPSTMGHSLSSGWKSRINKLPST